MSLKAGVGFRGGSTQPTRSAIALKDVCSVERVSFLNLKRWHANNPHKYCTSRMSIRKKVSLRTMQRCITFRLTRRK